MKFDQYKPALLLVGVVLLLLLIPLLRMRSQGATSGVSAPKVAESTQTQAVGKTTETESAGLQDSEGPGSLGQLAQSDQPTPAPPAKTPYLRNERPGVTSFQKFKATVAQQAAAYPESYFLEALDYDREVALTFDDGPDGVYTGQILDVLKKYNVKGTFFLLGSNMQRYPDVVRRIVAEGHAVGNHSYTHPDLRTLSTEVAYTDELGKAQQVFADLLGFEPAIFRPPYGAVTDEQIPYFAEQGLRTINWSIDTFDWDRKQNSVEEMTEGKVFHYLHEGGIILMHSAGGNRANTVAALPRMIEGLQKRGYQFKTVPELLEIPGKL